MSAAAEEKQEDVAVGVRRVVGLKRNLKVLLSLSERLEAGQSLGLIHQKLAEIEKKKKQLNDSIKSELSKLAEEAARLSRLLSNGYEFREVEVEEIRNYKEGTVTTIRLDTHEEESHRAMTSDEAQGHLFDTAPAVTTAEEAAKMEKGETTGEEPASPEEAAAATNGGEPENPPALMAPEQSAIPPAEPVSIPAEAPQSEPEKIKKNLEKEVEGFKKKKRGKR